MPKKNRGSKKGKGKGGNHNNQGAEQQQQQQVQPARPIKVVEDFQIGDEAEAVAAVAGGRRNRDEVQPEGMLHHGRVVVIAGPPGSGKGTASAAVVENTGMLHLSTGDMFRDAMKKKNELGREVELYISQGQFLPDELVTRVVLERLQQPDAKAKGVILDGYPRTRGQAMALVAKVEVERLVLLQCPDQVCVERILHRRIDPDTGAIFNLKTAPPVDAEQAAKLVRRDYDADEKVVQSRQRVYYAHLGLILPCFTGKIKVVNAADSIADTCKRVLEACNSPLDQMPAPDPNANNKKKKEKVPPVQEAAEEKEEEEEKVVEDRLPMCTVCMDEPAEYLVIPCGHQCGCQNCLAAIKAMNGPCPICRTPISDLIKVFRVGVVEKDEEQLIETQKLHRQHSVQGKPAAAAAAGAEAWGPDDSSDEDDDSGAADQKKGGADDTIVEILPCHDRPVPDEENKAKNWTLAVRVQPPDLIERQPVDVCCVVDISGSMSAHATYQDPNNPDKILRSELNILDLVKHAVRTVIKTLTPQDRISIVAFDTVSDMAFPLGKMDKAGQEAAEKALSALQPRNGTNIWQGLETGLDALRAPGDANQEHAARKKFVFLLTDGQPIVSPPKGHRAMLRAYKEKHPGLVCQVNTFGFGYQLDSEILLELADEGGGTFAFIPDAKILGTCFVDAIANAVSNMCQTAQLHLMPQNGAEFAGAVLGNLPTQDVAWGKVIELGGIQYGQARDVALQLTLPVGSSALKDGTPPLEAVLNYTKPDGSVARVSAVCSRKKASAAGLLALQRATVVSQGYQAVEWAEKKKGEKANKEWRKLEAEVKKAMDTHAKLLAHEQELATAKAKGHSDALPDAKNNPAAPAAAVATAAPSTLWGSITSYFGGGEAASDEKKGMQMEGKPGQAQVLDALHQDVVGRMAKAMNTPARFKRWGKHYNRAIIRSHQLQLCTNFMDPGLQFYGGKLFAIVRQQGGQIFVTLPAPTANHDVPPEVAKFVQGGQANRQRNNQQQNKPAAAPAPAPAPQPDMGAYYAGAGGGCFHGSTKLRVQNKHNRSSEQWSAIRNVRAGDLVWTGHGWAAVLCVVMIDRDNTRRPLVRFPSGVLVTPGHPVRYAKHGPYWSAARNLLGKVPGVHTEWCKAGEEQDSRQVYTLVLEHSHTLELAGHVTALTWGHERTEPHLVHPYLGTQRVVDDLKAMPGWSRGRVHVRGSLREVGSNRVVQLLA